MPGAEPPEDAIGPPEDAAGLAKWRDFAAIGLGFVTVVMSMTMMLVLLDPIAEEFDVSLRSVGWVVIVESLVISGALLPMGRLADAVGRKRMHVAGLVLFGLGAALSSLAPVFGLLIAARLVMAFGNAMVQSVGTAMIVAVFPPEERGKAIGSQTTAVSIGAASGPIIGGVALQWMSWDVVMLLLLVPIVTAGIAGVVLLDEDRVSYGSGDADARFDGWGASLSAIAIAALVVTLSNPFGVPWLSGWVAGGVMIGVAAFVAFVRVELAHPQPMLELRLFARPTFAFGVVARIVGFAGFSCVNLLMPLHLISVRGMSTGAAGVVLFLSSFAMGIAAQVAGRSSDRVGPRVPTVAGFGATVIVSLAFMTVTDGTQLWIVATAVFASGFALGTWNVPNNSSILGSVPTSRLGVTGAFTNLARTLGSVVGQAITTAVVVGVMASQGLDVPLDEIADTPGAVAAFTDGWRAGFAIAAGLGVLGLVMSVLASRRPADAVGN